MKYIGLYVFAVLIFLCWYGGIDYSIRGFLQASSLFMVLNISFLIQFIYISLDEPK
jgi:hypothetical protein